MCGLSVRVVVMCYFVSVQMLRDLGIKKDATRHAYFKVVL